MDKLPHHVKRAANKMLPVGSLRRKAVVKVLRGKSRGPAEDWHYDKWIKKHEPLQLHETIVTAKSPTTPLISIVVPCYNTAPRFVNELVASIIGQSYQNWQLCLVDGGSPIASRAKCIKEAALLDKRITYIKLPKNLGIAGNTNKGIERAKGKFIAFLDHDDILPIWALNEVAHAIKDNPKADIFYSDEDKLSDNGKKRLAPFFKPDWSPDLFLGVNYLAHFIVVRASLVARIGNLRLGFDGAQDYDFLLRAIERTNNIVHIPKILYHWRMTKGSTARAIGEKSYADETGKSALRDYLKRNAIAATVGESLWPTNYRIKFDLDHNTLVSVIIPFKDKIELLQACVASIKAKTSHRNYELILLTNNSVEQKTYDYLDTLKKDKKIKVLRYDKPFNYSAINNFGRRHASGEVLVFLNNDTEVVDKDWLRELASVALQKDRGAVGPMLLYPDETIQHAGVIVGLMQAAGHVFRNLQPTRSTFFGMPSWPRNYLAVTGACLAVEAKKFDAIGGFNESIIIAGSDVTLCLDLYEAGYLNVYWPSVRLLHYESKSVISYKNIPPTDYEISIEHYRPYLNYGDPYFNPNLDLDSEWPKLRTRQ